ncbi:MAG TPA: zf-HC2 domain-containing protein [Candidatus Polarisedimenticolia bacterium]|nr:zf-HC2 domain-containing protein [Candidatus Polarisedimenticolia bacterium]
MIAAGHPDEQTTAAYLEGRLPQAARDGVEAHLAACDTCRSGVALLRLGEEESDETVPPAALRRARGLAAGQTRRFVLPAGLAAGLLAALGLTIWLGGRGANRAAGGPEGAAEAPVERDAGAPALEAISPARGDVVPAGSLAFRWKTVAGADRYVVTLLDAGGAGIAAIETGPPTGPLAKNESTIALDWPADRPLPAAGTYLWTVRALALDRVLAETRPVPFEVR